MKYTSTRDNSISCSFEDALCLGYAPDGGLFVPEKLPTIDKEQLKKWISLSFTELGFEIMRLFIHTNEIDDLHLKEILMNSFEKNWDTENDNEKKEEEVEGSQKDMEKDKHIPIRRIGSYYVVELFHGPTFCFKDLGMRVIIQMLSYFSIKRQRKITLLVSTTGDTGPAAVQAVNDADNKLLTILVHYPYEQISNFQRKQLTTISYTSNVCKVATFHGGGDDMDNPIKNIISSNLSSNNKKNDSNNGKGDCLLTGINSYNIGRPLMQMVHFVWTYLRIVDDLNISPGDPNFPIDIVLPTGAMGNIVGGYIAKSMGIPIGKLCSGVNINDITYRVIHTGKFTKPKINEQVHRTLSEAINIQMPYNFERLLFYLTSCNHHLIKEWMTKFDVDSEIDLSKATINDATSSDNHTWLQELQKDFRCERITDDELCETMRIILKEYNYYIDPHTAVALCATQKLGYQLHKKKEQSAENKDTENIVAVLATASPCKFEEAVKKALGEEEWNTYLNESGLFPPSAFKVLSKPEEDPIVYEFEEGNSLKNVQIQWEKKAKQIIHDLQQIEIQ